MHLFHSLALTAGLFVAIGISGCASSSEPETPATPPEQATSTEGSQQAEPASSEEPSDSAAANLAKLSDADRAAAEKQKVCPVSGEPLGAMAVPVKITVKDQEVWLCCPNCEEKIKGDPDTYLAKLNK